MACRKCGGGERYADGRCAPCSRAANQRWKAANRDKHRAGSARWQAENVEACRAAGREFGRRNAAARAIYKRSWREKNREKHAADQQARRAAKAASAGTYTVDEWRALCAAYGQRCLGCSVTDRPLTVDHVVALSRGGSNSIENIQPLCGPCNSAKGARTIDYRGRWERLSNWPVQLELFEAAS